MGKTRFCDMATRRTTINGASAEELCGNDVRLTGLKGRADLNGLKANVVEWMEERGRYNIKIENTGEIVAIKPANLLTIEAPNEAEVLAGQGGVAAQSITGAVVKFQGLKGRADLNEKTGTIVSFLEDRARFNVRTQHSNEVIAVKPTNIKIISKPEAPKPAAARPAPSWSAPATAQEAKPKPAAAKPAPKKSPLKQRASANTKPEASPMKKQSKQAPVQHGEAKVGPSGSILMKGQAMIYIMTGEKVEVVKVHLDDDINDPYYTIKMQDGREKDTTRPKMTDEVTLNVGGTVIKETTTRLCREGDLLGKATLNADKTLSIDLEIDKWNVVLSYFKSLEVDGDRRGLVELPKARGGLKKVKKAAEEYDLGGLRFMTEKALAELVLSF